MMESECKNTTRLKNTMRLSPAISENLTIESIWVVLSRSICYGFKGTLNN
jgi:hypothetical protein